MLLLDLCYASLRNPLLCKSYSVCSCPLQLLESTDVKEDAVLCCSMEVSMHNYLKSSLHTQKSNWPLQTQVLTYTDTTDCIQKMDIVSHWFLNLHIEALI